MDLKELYKNHTDNFGLITPDGKESGNGILYTAQYIAAAKRYDQLPTQERNRLVDLYNSCESFPGLLMRAPEGKEADQQGPDDHYGALYADKILATGFAQRFLDHGETGANKYEVREGHPPFWTKALYTVLSLGGLRRVKNVYNQPRPFTFNLSSWMSRFPPLFGIARIVAGKMAYPHEILWLIVTLVKSAHSPKDNHDAKTLAWLKILCTEDKSILVRVVAKYWRYKVKKQFPNGMGEILGEYFQNYDHPSVRALWKIL